MAFNFFDAPATLMLLIVNVLVSGYALFADDSLIDRLGFQPRRIDEGGEYYRFITAGFVHAGLLHLGFNMYVLYEFGRFLEPRLGTGNFVVLYFGSMLAAHALTYWFQRTKEGYNAVGASGAVSGVVFALCLYVPFARIALFFAIPMYMWVFAVLYVAISIFAMKKASQQGQVGGIAHEAHLGGALGGVLLTILLEPDVLGHFLRQFGM